MTNPCRPGCGCYMCWLERTGIAAHVALSHAPDCDCSVCQVAQAAARRRRKRKEGTAMAQDSEARSR